MNENVLTQASFICIYIERMRPIFKQKNFWTGISRFLVLKMAEEDICTLAEIVFIM